jgi:hypothetical protein
LDEVERISLKVNKSSDPVLKEELQNYILQNTSNFENKITQLKSLWLKN